MAIITKRRKAYSVIYHIVDEDGKDKQIWETFYDYKSAVRRKTQIENPDNTEMRLSKETKIVDFLHDYISQQGLSIWSISRYQSAISVLNNYLKPNLKNKKIKNINLKFAEALMNDLSKTPAIGNKNYKTEKTIPYSMLSNCYSVLKGSFDYLVNVELLEYNPFHSITSPKIKMKKKNTAEWNQELVKQMFECCQNPKLFIALHLLFGCGLELSELFGLSWVDVHYEENSNYIELNKIAKRLNLNTLELMDQSKIITKFKSECFTATATAFTLLRKDKPRLVDIPYQLIPLLKKWKIMQQEADISSHQEHTFVIDEITGRPYGERLLSRDFAKLKEQMQQTGLTLVKLKNYGLQKNENNVNNAMKFYFINPQSLIMPKPVPKTHEKGGITNKKKHSFKERLDTYLPVDASDALTLLEQIKNNPELKIKLITKLQEELT